jgi:hypothetical protein
MRGSNTENAVAELEGRDKFSGSSKTANRSELPVNEVATAELSSVN